MTVVVIIGVLASIAIPSFMRSVRRARASEATMNLRRMFDSSVAYFDDYRADADGNIVPTQFPDTATPSPPLTLVGDKPMEPDTTHWSGQTWQALNFTIGDPHYYAYQYDSVGTQNSAQFTASAFGDLDGDGVYSTFARVGHVSDDAEVIGSDALYRRHDHE